MFFGLGSPYGRGESSLGEGAVKAAAAMNAGYTLPPGLIAVLDASPDFQILLAPDQTILFANAAFHATNPDEAGPLVGRSLADSLMGRDARRAASRRIILDTVRQALATGGVIRPPIFRYDIQKDIRQPPREAWWRLCACPCDLDGRPCLLLTTSEVTAAVSMGRTDGEDVVIAAGSRPAEALMWAERRRLSQMFDQTADMMALLVGPEHVFEMINPAMKRAAGDAQLLGRSLRDVVRSDQGREILRRLDEMRDTGLPFTALARPFRMTAEADEDRYLDLTLQPLTNDEGEVEAIFCRGQDVTEQVRTLAVQQFLREELAHCQGNTLAVVLALAEQSSVHAASLDEFKTVFAGRLAALAAVNATLNTEGPDVSLAGLFKAVAQRGGLEGRLGGSGGGAKLRPKAALTMGLMFHELLQLSNSGEASGSTWPRIRAHQRAGCLHLIWMASLSRDFEQDGGDFAHRLFDHAVRHDFGGRWRVLRHRKSTAFCFEFPLTHPAWSDAGAVP
jgi:PAS domain S-box-containing protein